MEKHLFKIAIAAAKRESLAGYNDNAMDYLKSALGYANALKSARGRSAVMRAMNAIRASEKRKAVTPAVRKASPLHSVIVSQVVTLQHAMIGAVCLVGALIGMALPMHEPQGGFDLVEYRGDNAYIVDFNQSVSDCAVILPAMRAAGHKVACETPAAH